MRKQVVETVLLRSSYPLFYSDPRSKRKKIPGTNEERQSSGGGSHCSGKLQMIVVGFYCMRIVVDYGQVLLAEKVA